MKFFSHRRTTRQVILAAITAGALAIFSLAIAAEAMGPEELSTAEDSGPGPVGLGVSGASAGITTDYFEQAAMEALVASEIFSSVDNSKTAEVVMPMIRAEGVFASTATSADTPYFLNIRIIEVDTPSFSARMTVSMNAIWTLYRVAEKTELLHENIFSTYTGGMLEGGVHGANRVRVAMEGAARENVRIGVAMLASLDLEQEQE